MQVETSTLADRVIWWVLRNFSDTHISRAFLSWERLFGYWLVSPTLFNEEETFPYLREVQIQGVFITHDNLWYFTGNSTDVEASYQHSRHDGDDADDGDSSTRTLPSIPNSGIPARSDEPYHMWRTQPDPRIFDPLMKTIATGVLRMPQLERFLFLIGMGYTDDDGIIFECLTSGEHPEWFQNPHKMVELDTTRCYVTLMPEAKWEIPRDIATLWKKFVGDKDSFLLRP